MVRPTLLLKNISFCSCRAVIAVLTLFILLPDYSAFCQDTEWNSVTHRRVNLRAQSTQQSSVVATVEMWTPVIIVEEIPGWYSVRLENGSTGWISSDFVISRNVLENIDPVRSQPDEDATISDTTTSAQPEKSEFTSEREPVSGSEFTDRLETQSFLASNFDNWHLNLFIPLILGFSIIANIVLVYITRNLQSVTGLKESKEKYKADLEILKNSNEDHKKQLSFAKETIEKLEKSIQKSEKDRQLRDEMQQKELSEQKNRFNALEESHEQCPKILKEKEEQSAKITQENRNLSKEIEALHQKMNRTHDNLQQQAVKLTLSEQKHSEALLQKQNNANSLQEELDMLRQEKDEFDKNLAAKVEEYEKEIAQINTRKNELEQQLGEMKEETQARIDEALKEKENKFSEELESRLTTEIEKFESAHSEQLKQISANASDEKEAILNINNRLEQEVLTLKDRMKSVEAANVDLEKRVKSLKEAEVKESEEPVVDQELESIKKEYESLLSNFEEKKNMFSEAEKSWILEREQFALTIDELKSGLSTAVIAEDGEVKEEPEPVIEEETPEIVKIEEKPVKPVPEETRIESKADFQYEDYARSFFKQIKKL